MKKQLQSTVRWLVDQLCSCINWQANAMTGTNVSGRYSNTRFTLLARVGDVIIIFLTARPHVYEYDPDHYMG